MATVTKDEVIEQLFSDICYLAFKHEVQSWKDADGTDAEKLKGIVRLAREGLALSRGTVTPEDLELPEKLEPYVEGVEDGLL